MFNITRYYVEVKEDKLKQRACLTVSATNMIFFMRYGIVRKGRERDYLCHIPGEELRWQSPAAPRLSYPEDGYLSAKDVPALPPYGFAYAAFPLRCGYLYAYYETDDKWLEFWISSALQLQKIEWDAENAGKDVRRVKWDSKLGGVDGYKGLPVGNNQVVWVAYSEVQWSAAYAVKVLTTPSLREGRMQRIDVGKWKEGTALDDEFVLSDTPFFAHQIDSSAFEELRIKTNALLKQNKEEEEFPDFFFLLHDPLGAADDVKTYLQQEYDYLDALAACAPLGTNPREMKKDEYRRFSSTLESSRQEDYEALFSTGLTLYLSLFNKIGTNGNPDLEKYRRQLDVQRLRAMLGVEKRAKQREVIQGIREVLGSLICSNYYQNVLFDYSENCLQSRLDGEIRIVSEHYGLLADLPRFHDCHLDLYNPSTRQEDDWRNLVAAYFSGETLANPSELLSPQWQFRKQSEAVQVVSYRLHHKDYGTGSVSTLSRITLDKLVTNLLVALGLYGPFVGTKLKHEQLVSKLNRLKIDKEEIVVLKDKSIGQIMDDLDEDLKKLRNKPRKFRRERGAAFRTRAEGRIAKLEKDAVITLKHANEELRQTRARVLEFLKERKRFSPDNSEVVALLGELQVAINAVNVGLAFKEVMKEGDDKNIANLASASFALISSTLSLSTECMRTLDLRLTRLFFKKNIHIRFSTRLSWVASILSAVVDGFSTYERFSNRDYNAGLCYALAAASGVGVTVGAVGAIWFSALWGGPLAWAFVAVGFSTGILAEIISKDDFELFLSNSVFGKELSPSVRAHPNAGIAGPSMSLPVGEGATEKLTGKLPHEVMEMLYAYGSGLNKTLKLSGEDINMGAFKKVEGWLREFFLHKKESCDYLLFEIDTKKVPSPVLGINYQKTTALDKLRFSCSFAIPKPATIGVECVLYLYLVHVDNKSALIRINPYGDLKVTKDDPGELYTFDVRFPAICKKVSEFVTEKEWNPYIRWYDYVDRKRSCYFLTYRIYTDMDDKENYMPYTEEWYVRTLPFIDYQESAQVLNARRELQPKSYKEFQKLKNNNNITTW